MAKSPEGKKISSLNRLTHGLRSKMRLLADESEEEYRATVERWMGQYVPSDWREERLLDQLIVNDWFMQRATRRMMEAEARDPEEPDYEYRIGLMQRYKVTAERAFYRSVGAVESLRRNLFQSGLKMQAMEAREAEKMERASRAAEKGAKNGRRSIQLAEQWVEVRRDENGRTVTEAFPGNEELREEVEKLDPKRDLVYRRFHFVDGVPDEYAWTTNNEEVRLTGGAGIQRIRPRTWFALVEKEAREGNGHMLPSGGNIPRPEERGGCDCEVCTQNRWLLEEEEE